MIITSLTFLPVPPFSNAEVMDIPPCLVKNVLFRIIKMLLCTCVCTGAGGVTDMGYSMAGWKLNLDFLKEHQVLLATVPFLRPRDFISDSWLMGRIRLKAEAATWQELDDWMRARTGRDTEVPTLSTLYKGPFKVLVLPQVMWLGYENSTVIIIKKSVSYSLGWL